MNMSIPTSNNKVLDECNVRQTVSENYNAEKVRVGVGLCVQLPFGLTFFDSRFEHKTQQTATLID